MGFLSKISDLCAVFDNSPAMQTAKTLVRKEKSKASPRQALIALNQAELTEEMRGIIHQGFISNLDQAASYRSWDFYGKLCRAFWKVQHPHRNVDAAFEQNMFHEGQFPGELTRQFVELALSSPTVTYQIDDAADGYYANRSTVVPYVDTYNKIFVFRKLSPEAMRALEGCLNQITELVENCLQSHWRIVQVRYWETKSGGEGIGTNGWHTDGFPLDAIKILSFFSPTDEDRGSTQFRLKDGSVHTFKGEAGKFILFRNSVIEHCGLPPGADFGNRLTVETTIAPALETDPRPIFAGTNGHYPYVPWQRIS